MTRIAFNQIPAVCERLLGERRYDDALRVLFAFIEHGTPHYPALRECLKVADEMGRSKAVDQTMEAVRQRSPDDVRTWWLDARLQQT